MTGHLRGFKRLRRALRDNSSARLGVPLPSTSASFERERGNIQDRGSDDSKDSDDSDDEDNKKHGNQHDEDPDNWKGSGSGGNKDRSNDKVLPISSALEKCGVGGKGMAPPDKTCVVLNDVLPSFKYGDKWKLTTPDNNAVKGTTHFTTANGNVTVDFFGTQIYVMGILLPNGSPPDASYSIDGQNASAGESLPAVKMCTRNLFFFKSQNLPASNHSLRIDVTTAAADHPYILDYVFVCNNDPHSAKDPHREGVIVGAVLGSVIFLLITGFLVWILIRRRRRRQQQLRQLQISASPVSSWLRWQSDGPRSATTFTSPQSIFAYNPTSTSSEVKTIRRVSTTPSLPMPPPGLGPDS